MVRTELRNTARRQGMAYNVLYRAELRNTVRRQGMAYNVLYSTELRNTVRRQGMGLGMGPVRGLEHGHGPSKGGRAWAWVQ